MNETVIVVIGADPIAPKIIAGLPSDAIVIAADGGLDRAIAAGLRPATLVGDLDSITAVGMRWAEANATIHRHDPDKDRTDTELALAIAVDLDPERLILLSGGGDRLDHAFAAIGALGHPSLTSIPRLEAVWGDQRVTVLHGPGQLSLDQPVGTTLSLLALHGTCRGVTIDGVKWPLELADLRPLVGVGVSNLTTLPTVDVSVLQGVLTIMTTLEGSE